eukprot:gnl/Chilomastix_cuspidata/624.p1 GENE.gnl/Chilomastix_cuspidata/624~~gnl/Chilomastix_cuspidata/624.p1  ORF type:complete len:450 (-),score=160.72 gnl/Chilomastix_cuspidata/624:126-1475(-)
MVIMNDKELFERASKLCICAADLEVIKLLGKGSKGKAYLCSFRSDTLISKDVVPEELRPPLTFVVKVISLRHLSPTSMTYQLLKNQSSLVASQHPNILTLYNTFSDKRNVYIMMEFCPGGDFYWLLKRLPNNRLPEPDARFYILEIAKALAHLHRKDIIYRDLKPENVLIARDGHIRICDFDLSKSLKRPRESLISAEPEPPRGHSHCCPWRKSAAQMSASARAPQGQYAETFCGTPEYFAPEMILYRKYTFALDWWTLGVFAYEILVGQTPFFATSRELIMDNIRTYARAKPNGVTFPRNSRLSKHARDFVAKLLDPNQLKRLGASGGFDEIRAHPFLRKANSERMDNPPISFSAGVNLNTYTGNFIIAHDWPMIAALDWTGTRAALPPKVAALRPYAENYFRTQKIPLLNDAELDNKSGETSSSCNASQLDATSEDTIETSVESVKT